MTVSSLQDKTVYSPQEDSINLINHGESQIEQSIAIEQVLDSNQPPNLEQVILEDDFQDQWFKVKLKDVLYQLEKWKSKRNQD